MGCTGYVLDLNNYRPISIICSVAKVKKKQKNFQIILVLIIFYHHINLALDSISLQLLHYLSLLMMCSLS